MKRRFHWTRGPGDAGDEVRREIDEHLELRAREFEAQGMDPESARRAAANAFGDRSQIEQEIRTLRTGTIKSKARRDRWGALSQDLRTAVRGLIRAPGFAIAALLTLALGIGATSAVFSVVRSVLLRPLPYPDADRLVQLWTDHRARGRTTPEWFQPPEFLEYQRRNTTFSAMAAYGGWGPNLTGEGEPQSLNGGIVTWQYFRVLGIGPVLGRDFTEADDRPEAEPVVLLSDGLWRSRFGADRNVVGRQIQLNGQSWTVLGVLPRDFRPPVAAEIWRPFRRPADAGCGWGCVTWRAIGRMKPGVSFQQARQDLDRVAGQIAAEQTESNRNVGSWPIPLHEQITGQSRKPLFAIGGAVVFVLLIGCVNIASLLLLRGSARARELSVRAAIGAGRGRLVRQLLTESTVLAIIGGVLGTVAGWWGSRILSGLVPPTVRSVQNIQVDWLTLAFTAGLTLLAGVLFGVLPSLSSARADLMGALRTSNREAARRTQALRSGLVTVEIAVAVLLLVGGGLLGRSFLTLTRTDLGFRTENLATAGVIFPAARYDSAAKALAAIEATLARVRAMPGIVTAEAVDQLPLLGGGDQDLDVVPVGEPLPSGRSYYAVWYRTATPGYLSAMQMRQVEGRGFTPQDRAGAPVVVIVNQEAARRMWGGKSPVGRPVRVSGVDATVIGVVANARPDGPMASEKAEIFLPLLQFPSRGVAVVVESGQGPSAAIAALRSAVREVDPLVPLAGETTLEAMASDVIALPRVYALLLSIFAAAALGLALIGVYGVMAYSVAQRQREIGVRLALGAGPGAIRGLVLSRGVRLVGIGLLCGLGGAALVTRLIQSLLFGVPALDAITFGGVALLLGAMALFACWGPVRRASRVDPVVVLREE